MFGSSSGKATLGGGRIGTTLTAVHAIISRQRSKQRCRGAVAAQGMGVLSTLRVGVRRGAVGRPTCSAASRDSPALLVAPGGGIG